MPYLQPLDCTECADLSHVLLDHDEHVQQFDVASTDGRDFIMHHCPDFESDSQWHHATLLRPAYLDHYASPLGYDYSLPAISVRYSLYVSEYLRFLDSIPRVCWDDEDS